MNPHPDRASYERACRLIEALERDQLPHRVLSGLWKVYLIATANALDAARVATEADGLEEGWNERKGST